MEFSEIGRKILRKDTLQFPPELPKPMKKALLQVNAKYLESVNTGGPRADCEHVVNQLMPFGFNKGRGAIKLDTPPTPNNSPEAFHKWLIYNDVYYDITLCQYNPWLNQENQVPDGLVIIRRGDPLYDRYLIDYTFDQETGKATFNPEFDNLNKLLNVSSQKGVDKF